MIAVRLITTEKILTQAPANNLTSFRSLFDALPACFVLSRFTAHAGQTFRAHQHLGLERDRVNSICMKALVNGSSHGGESGHIIVGQSDMDGGQ